MVSTQYMHYNFRVTRRRKDNYMFMIIITILLTMLAFLQAKKYMITTKINPITIISTCLVAIGLSKIIVGIILRNHRLEEYSFVKEIGECGLAVSISYIIIYIAMNVWNKRHGCYHKLRNVWIFLVIFVNEIASISRVIHLSPVKEEIPGLLLQFVLDIAVYLILFNLLIKERLTKELEELHYHMKIERIRYQEMDKEREAMAKLRHDYNNQLTSVLGLLHIKREDAAKELLKEMRRERYD